MSNQRPVDIKRLIPGEPIPQCGGMTPEQFGDFAARIEDLVLTTFRSADGPLSMWSHLACRIFLMVEDVAGREASDKVMQTFIEAMADEMQIQRRHMDEVKAKAKEPAPVSKDLH